MQQNVGHIKLISTNEDGIPHPMKADCGGIAFVQEKEEIFIIWLTLQCQLRYNVLDQISSHASSFSTMYRLSHVSD